MPELSLRDEALPGSWQIWPDPEPVPSGRVRETGTYLFELTGGQELGSATLTIDDVPLEGLRPSGAAIARWRWSPGFHAGTVEGELRLPGRAPQRFEVITDPDRRKLTRDDFDIMVREILDDTFALFSLSSFRKGVGKGTGGKPPPIARLEFLRSRIAELEETAQAIARGPRRSLAAEDAAIPYHRAVRATGPEIIRSMRSGRLLREAGAGPSRLPVRLRGFLPEKVLTRQRRTTLDIAEHRQMAACLRSWAGWLSEAASLLSRTKTGGDDELGLSQTVWAKRCRGLARRVSQLTGLPPFAEAGESAPWLMASPLFRRDPAYRRFFRLWQDINLGIAAVFGDFLNMPLARTYELYELWCFLRIVRAGAETWGPAGLDVKDLFLTSPSGGVTIAAGAVTVPVGAGWRLCFQKRYQEFWKEADLRGSFSREMVPDIVLDRETPASAAELSRLIVLDAKYRVEQGLGDALNSIHTYRDALVHETGAKPEAIVCAAYLLAPYVPQLEAEYRDTALPGRLFHPEYRRCFKFGAVTLRPGMTTAEVAEALKLIVADATGL